MKKIIFFLIRLAITIGVFYILFRLIPYGEVLAVYRDSSKLHIVFGFLLLLIAHIVAGMRWRFVLKHMGLKVPRGEVLCMLFSGLFFNLFFPSLIAGDAARIFFLTRKFRDVKKGTASVLIDRFSGVVGLVCVVTGGFFLGRDLVGEPEIFLGVVTLVAIGLGVVFLIFHPFFFSILERASRFRASWHEKVCTFHGEFALVRRRPSVFLILSLGYSLIIQSIGVLTCYVLARGMGAEVGLIYFFILIPITMLISFIPVTIAGLGTRELVMVYLFSKVGMAQSVSFSMSLLSFIFLLLIGLLGGLVYVTLYHRRLEHYS